MKILHVNASLDPMTGGGVAERTSRLAVALQVMGLENRILTTGTVKSQRIEELSPVRITALPLVSSRFRMPMPLSATVNDAVSWADIVHIVGHWAPINAMVLGAIQRNQRPYLICPAGAIPAFGRSLRLKAYYDYLWGRRLISGATRGIAVVENEMEAFAGYGLSPDKVCVIPNGVVIPPSSSPSKVMKIDKKPFILFLGRLSYIKGPDILLQAFLSISDRIPDFELVFAGPDEGMSSDLLRILETSPNRDRIQFHGFVDGEQKSKLLETATLLVVPSRREAMSIVALEAGAHATPVLLTDQCGFDDIQLHGGAVVQATVESVSAGLLGLLENRERLRARGEALFEHIRSQYSWKRAASRYLRVFHDVLP
jgi:glycosyltransferase involved in cell wall biosynthesis